VARLVRHADQRSAERSAQRPSVHFRRWSGDETDQPSAEASMEEAAASRRRPVVPGTDQLRRHSGRRCERPGRTNSVASSPPRTCRSDQRRRNSALRRERPGRTNSARVQHSAAHVPADVLGRRSAHGTGTSRPDQLRRLQLSAANVPDGPTPPAFSTPPRTSRGETLARLVRHADQRSAERSAQRPSVPFRRWSGDETDQPSADASTEEAAASRRRPLVPGTDQLRRLQLSAANVPVRPTPSQLSTPRRASRADRLRSAFSSWDGNLPAGHPAFQGRAVAAPTSGR
jgi:hypothetical protein